MKIGFLLVAGFFFATTAQAQRTHGATVMTGGGVNYSSGGGVGGGTISGSIDMSMHHQVQRKHEIGYAKNDGEFVPSTYMNYDDALALGKQQLAVGEQVAQSAANLSLGDVARFYRTIKVANLQARVFENESGKIRFRPNL